MHTCNLVTYVYPDHEATAETVSSDCVLGFDLDLYMHNFSARVATITR